jgi:hypothetical protein
MVDYRPRVGPRRVGHHRTINPPRPGDESVPVTPLFGLSSTTIADRALGERIRIPAAKLSGRRPFTVTPPPSRPSGCPADGFDPCTEQGGFTLHVTFTPAHR